MNDEVKITWHGHSCFSMRWQSWCIVVDPYADKYVPGLPPLRLTAGEVFCSHDHGDHNARSCVELDAIYPVAPAGFRVETAVCAHDDAGGTKRGLNTVHVFHFGTLKVAHMGDIGCMPGEDVLSLVRGCDLMLIPVGGFYTVDADGAADIVRAARPRAVVPMHYRGRSFGFDVLDGVKPFLGLFLDKTVLESPGFTLTADAPAGIIVPALH